MTINPDMLVKATSVEVVAHPVLRITYADGLVGDRDLTDAIARIPLLEPLSDPEFFSKCAVIHDGGAIGWPGDIDIDAGAQRQKLTPALRDV